MDVSQMSSNVSKPETEEHESDPYQYEHDQECDGDEVNAVKGKGKCCFKGTWFRCGMRGHSRSMLGERERKRKQGRLGERNRWIQRERMVQKKMVKSWSHVGQFLVQFTVAPGKRTVTRWIRGRLWNLFLIPLCSQFELKLRGVFWTETHDERNAHWNVAAWKTKEFRSREQNLNSCA